MIDTVNRSSRASVATSAVLAATGLAFGAFAVLWLTGTFGLTGIAASNLSTAFEVGGWALSIALLAFSGGVSGAMYAAYRVFAATMGRAAARAAFIA